MSANADSYQVFIRGQNASDGGTSASTPLWAALIALVNQGIGTQVILDGDLPGARAWLLETILDALPAALNDVTTGDNGAYSAGPVWDACTGLGSPKGTAILLGYRAVRQSGEHPHPAVTGRDHRPGWLRGGWLQRHRRGQF